MFFIFTFSFLDLILPAKLPANKHFIANPKLFPHSSSSDVQNIPKSQMILNMKGKQLFIAGSCPSAVNDDLLPPILVLL